MVVREVRRKKKGDLGELGDMLADGSELGARSLELEGSLQASGSELQASDSEGPEGLDVNVSLPRKKVKGLMMLSGGERALTSIALLFAISQVNPPPFIILDETDAALDEANSRKYGDMIEDLSKHSQLILITPQPRDHVASRRSLWCDHGRRRRLQTAFHPIRRSGQGGEIVCIFNLSL